MFDILQRPSLSGLAPEKANHRYQFSFFILSQASATSGDDSQLAQIADLERQKGMLSWILSPAYATLAETPHNYGFQNLRC